MNPSPNNVSLSRTRSGRKFVKSQERQRSPTGCPPRSTRAVQLHERHQSRKPLKTRPSAAKIVNSQTKGKVREVISPRYGKECVFNYEQGDKRVVSFARPNTTKSSFRRKTESKRKFGIFKCPICKTGIRAASNLKRHMLIHSSSRPIFKCQECGQVLLSKESLQRHQRLVHEGERAFSCGLCTSALKTKGNLIRHIQFTHSTSHEIARNLANEGAAEPRPVSLPEKKITFDNLFIRRSRARPDPGSSHKCPECKMFFKSEHLLSRHLVIHKDIRPFACRFCVWIFKRKDNLMMHIQKMHGKSEKEARKMVYGYSGPYNPKMRRFIRPSIVKPISNGGNARKTAKKATKKIISRAPPPKPKLEASHRDVIVIVGNLKFCTPRIRLQPCDADPQDFVPKLGCQTYEQWFWQDYCHVIDERNCAPLIQTEPEYEHTLVEMAELNL